jgi:hypothetical protein
VRIHNPAVSRGKTTYVKIELLYRQYFATPVPLDFMPENADF